MQVCNTKNRFCQIFCTLIFGNMHGIKQQNIHPWTLLLRNSLQYETNHPNSPSSSISRLPRRAGRPPRKRNTPSNPSWPSTQLRRTGHMLALLQFGDDWYLTFNITYLGVYGNGWQCKNRRKCALARSDRAGAPYFRHMWLYPTFKFFKISDSKSINPIKPMVRFWKNDALSL